MCFGEFGPQWAKEVVYWTFDKQSTIMQIMHSCEMLRSTFLLQSLTTPESHTNRHLAFWEIPQPATTTTTTSLMLLHPSGFRHRPSVAHIMHFSCAFSLSLSSTNEKNFLMGAAAAPPPKACQCKYVAISISQLPWLHHYAWVDDFQNGSGT